MNNRGEVTIGMLILIAVAVIVGLTLLTGGISSNVGTLTNKVAVIGEHYTFPNASAAVNYVTLKGQAVESVTVKNRTGDVTIPASNYTITSRVLNNGVLESRLTAVDTTYVNYLVNVSYTYEPFGYDTNGGGRAIANLIIIFAALAIAVVVLVPIVKNIGDFT